MDVVLMLESLGKLPQGAHEEKCRSKLFERKFHFQGRQIIIQEDFTGDVGEIVWEMYVESHAAFPPGFWKGKRVLELGAGTGLLGIVLALLGAEVFVTDIPPVLELLQLNVTAACDAHTEISERLFARELDWFKEIPDDLKGPWDFVLMADVVYDPALFAPLVNTLVKLHDPHTNLILGYEWRHNTDRGFFALLREHFEMQKIDPALYRAENGIEPRSDISLFRLQRHSAQTDSAEYERGTQEKSDSHRQIS